MMARGKGSPSGCAEWFQKRIWERQTIRENPISRPLYCATVVTFIHVFLSFESTTFAVRVFERRTDFTFTRKNPVMLCVGHVKNTSPRTTTTTIFDELSSWY